MTDRREAYNALMKFYPLTLDDLPDEIWRPIKRYEDFYHVSNYGRVKSFCKGNVCILKPQLKNGYLAINFHVGKKLITHTIHRLVAEAFIPNPDAKPQVNHLDGHKLNNYVDNLEWATASENICHAHDMGLTIHSKGGDRSDAALTNKQARYVRDNPAGLTGRALAKMFGVNPNTISLIQLGKTYCNVGGIARESEKHPNRKLSDIVRTEIRRLYVRNSKDFGSTALAEKFGVSSATILNIVKEGGD